MEQVALVILIIKLFDMSEIHIQLEWIPAIRLLLCLCVFRLIFISLRRY
jgi:hypothetical protein